MLTLAHGHHGAALPPTRWLLPLHRAPASCPARRRKPLHWYKMSMEVGHSFRLMPHMGCEWRGEFAMGMPEAAC